MRLSVTSVALVLAAAVAGCATHQTGPERPIAIIEDVEMARTIIARDLADFPAVDPTSQAILRNEILTARMYIADMEYHRYEARLTREIQDEGLLATAASLGLTTSATLLSPAGTKSILSGIATGVTGLDKGYNEKVLLSNTIQALQTQMRADRKTQAGTIYAKMFKDLTSSTRVVTPIIEYTLPMALSDLDTYYQAGTVSSALIGLSKTVANADQTADQVKAATGPNPSAVATVKTSAAPLTPSRTERRVTVLRDVNAPLQRLPQRQAIVSQTRLGDFESKLMLSSDMRLVLTTLCRPTSEQDLGPAGSPARKALAKFLADNGRTSVETLNRNAFIDIQELSSAGKKGC